MRNALKASAARIPLEYNDAGNGDAKDIAEQIARAFEEFKATNDNQIAEIKKGMKDVVTEEKLKRIDDAIEASITAKAALEKKLSDRSDELEKKLNRQAINGGDDDDARIAEIKSFNHVLAAHAVSKNRQYTVLDGQGYDEYRAAFGNMLRTDNRLLTPEEIKTLSVGSDPDGGYFVTPDISGRIVKKIYETSPMRQLASAMTISTDALEG